MIAPERAVQRSAGLSRSCQPTLRLPHSSGRLGVVLRHGPWTDHRSREERVGDRATWSWRAGEATKPRRRQRRIAGPSSLSKPKDGAARGLSLQSERTEAAVSAPSSWSPVANPLFARAVTTQHCLEIAGF